MSCCDGYVGFNAMSLSLDPLLPLHGYQIVHGPRRCDEFCEAYTVGFVLKAFIKGSLQMTSETSGAKDSIRSVAILGLVYP
jgi:hypothetical protein